MITTRAVLNTPEYFLQQLPFITMDNSNEAEEQKNDSSMLSFIGGLFSDFYQTDASFGPTLVGALIDGVAVFATTFVGSWTYGKVGAAAGGFTGIAIIGVSRALGYNSNYKSMPSIIKEDLTEEKREQLGNRFLNRVKNFL